jgi:ubiquinone/menaquinone biosynthesis C-methylase UbiE
VSDAERERIRRVYAAYDADPAERAKRDGENDGLRYIKAERRRRLASVLEKAGALPLTNAIVLDVGCGLGHELAELRDLGAIDSNLHGVDVLPDRLVRARASYSSIAFHEGDGRALPFADEMFDLVTVNVVFSSILDDAVASSLAAEVRRVTTRNGLIVVYDNRYPSPNPHVRPYGKRRLRELFPEADIQFTPLTLLPPLARFIGPRYPRLLPLLSRVTPLKARHLSVIRRRIER